MNLLQSLKTFPFIAITRGITPDQAPTITQVLYEEGFRIIENPLNSPDPIESIRAMSETVGSSAMIGAGTVTDPKQVVLVKEAGGSIIISPHCDPAIIRETKKQGLLSMPGVATPTEAMTALQNGADALKLFPAEMITPRIIKAFRAVLPPETLLLPVGSITSDNWQPYMNAGASGFGLGSSLFRNELTPDQLRKNAKAFGHSWEKYPANP
ncbi:2-dehydro-3-deoxy-6-phosphogalactonate aldolase [Desulfopila sp. IMCC35008]|uniref:2-dehydro-3-deoxy-6-phosphogalactonate aldolase n=1 Tax=Desulfopila sp. IMCC35008 TaxID=2653858 RepID=UPI0013D89F07|nr:2-dehydro-3-deoxy-6-phosphogalactonate aldolase [Desulfopila sp. IMCC35008]